MSTITHISRDRRILDADVSDLTGDAAAQVANRTPHPSVGDSERQALEDWAGECSLTLTTEQLDKLEALCDRLAFVRAGEALRHVVLHLGKTPAGLALQRVLLGSAGSLERDAKTVRCTKQNLAHHEKTVRKRLSHLTV